MDVEARVRVGIRDRRWLSGKVFLPLVWTSLRPASTVEIARAAEIFDYGSWVRIIRLSWSRFHPDKLHVGEEGREGEGYLQGMEPEWAISTVPPPSGDSRESDELCLILG